ncbi:MAG: outer membrane lipoprotein-sorting protein [Terracidiphilus sp.]|jgi:hypothetical protein
MKDFAVGAVLGFALGCGPVSYAASTPAALAGPRQAIANADYRVVGRLVSVDPGGKRTSEDITIKAHNFSGVLRVLVEITAPASARARILLEMRQNGESSIRIAHPGDKALASIPFDKWNDGPVGPGFSYEDFLQQEFLWPGQSVQESVRWGTHDCDLVKSTPGPADKTHYAEVRTWLDHKIDFPVYVEKVLKASGPVKEYTSFGLRHDEGVWSATQIEEKTHGQAGSTLLIINRGSPKAKLTLEDFGADRIIHF